MPQEFDEIGVTLEEQTAPADQPVRPVERIAKLIAAQNLGDWTQSFHEFPIGSKKLTWVTWPYHTKESYRSACGASSTSPESDAKAVRWWENETPGKILKV